MPAVAGAGMVVGPRPQVSSSGIPASFMTPANFPNWRRIVVNARAGSASGKLLLIGDSLTEGGGVTPSIATESVPTLLANLLANDVPAQATLSIPGIAGTDSRWNTTAGGAPAGWSQHIQTSGFAGNNWQGIVGADPLTYAPGVMCDTIDVWYPILQGIGAGTVNMSVDGGAPVAVNQNGFDAITKATFNVARSADHVVSIDTITIGTARVLAIDCYDSTVPSVHVGNGGVGGSQTLWWSNDLVGYDSISTIKAYAPDVAAIGLGVNDSNGSGISVAQFVSQYSSIIEAAKASGDVLLWTECPSQLNKGFSLTAQAAYRQATYGMAQTFGCGLADVFARYGSWIEANSLGFMADLAHQGFVHPSLLGNWDIASALKSALALVQTA